MNAVGARRLLKLADFLQTVHHSKFNLNEWVAGKKPKEMAENPLEKGDCGTTGCAVGWLPAIFPKSWGWSQPKTYYDSMGNPTNAEVIYKRWPDHPMTQGQTLQAAADFFSIDYGDSCELFMPGEYPDGDGTRAKQVAQRIRSFVKMARD